MSKRAGDPGYAPGWCIHYRSPQHGSTCEAGEEFAQWRGRGHDVTPCFLTKDGKSKPGALPCPHLRLPTPEEIVAHEKWAADHFEKQVTVMTGILPWRKAHKGKSAQEVVECPACKGRLHLSIAAYNGHVHGRCETSGCVSWME